MPQHLVAAITDPRSLRRGKAAPRSQLCSTALARARRALLADGAFVLLVSIGNERGTALVVVDGVPHAYGNCVRLWESEWLF